MIRLRSHTVLLSILLAGIALPCCSESQGPAQNTAQPAVNAPVSAIDLSNTVGDSTPPEKKAEITGAQPRPATALRPATAESPSEELTSSEFTRYSAPGWLDDGPGGVGHSAASNTGTALPDLFERPAGRKPVSMGGGLLLKDNDNGSIPRVEGAGVSIELKTN